MGERQKRVSRRYPSAHHKHILQTDERQKQLCFHTSDSLSSRVCLGLSVTVNVCVCQSRERHPFQVEVCSAKKTSDRMGEEKLH